MAEYDLISKTALLKHLDMAMDCKDCPRNINRKTYYDRCACTEVGDICNTITDFATFADVQPVKHGRWIDSTFYDPCEKSWEQNFEFECSNCGHKIYNKPNGDNLFCGHCGARMDLKDGDAE